MAAGGMGTDNTITVARPHAIVIGGGPAGLMAAGVLCDAGVQVDLYDAMPSVGRKFLLAGRGGLNLTHAEPTSQFLSRFGDAAIPMHAALQGFDGLAVRAWSHGLGIDTFVGSSGRVFPVGMKAAPLLRAFLHRLRAGGVRFHMRHRWLGWNDQALRFAIPSGEMQVDAATNTSAVVLALGGASWSRLGSDGAWMPLLQEKSVDVTPLLPSNCGFDVSWSSHFIARHAGQPLKSVMARFTDRHGRVHERNGEMMVTATGLEGSLIYAWSAMLRDAIAANGSATLTLDLAPGRDGARVHADVMHPRGARSLSSHLQSRLGIHGVKAGLLRECLGGEAYGTPARLAAGIKSLPVTLQRPRPIDEAISSAGGVRFTALDENQMLQAMPGVFCAGEMLDWEAPTGGYLLTGCLASGRAAGEGVLRWWSASTSR